MLDPITEPRSRRRIPDLGTIVCISEPSAENTKASSHSMKSTHFTTSESVVLLAPNDTRSALAAERLTRMEPAVTCKHGSGPVRS